MTGTRRLRGAAEVWRDDEVRRVEQRIVGGQRLGRHHIERRAADLVRLQCRDQRGLVDYAASCGIDEDGVRLHPRERRGIEHPGRLLGQRHMRRDEVSPCIQLMERDTVAGEVGHLAPAGVDDAHPEGQPAPGDRRADPSGADDPQGRLAEVTAQHPPRVPLAPLASADRGFALRQPSRRSEEQGEREVSSGVGQDARGVRHQHAALARRIDVDVVVADRHVRDRTHRRTGVQETLVDLLRDHRQQAVAVLGVRAEVLGRWRIGARPDIDIGRCFEACEGFAAGQLPAHEDAGARRGHDRNRWSGSPPPA